MPDLEAGVAALDALAPAERAAVVARDVGEDSPLTATHHATLTVYLAVVGRHADALAVAEPALAAARAAGLGEESPVCADAHYGLGLAHAVLGRPAAARAAYARARAAYRAAGNPYLVAVAAIG